MESHQETGEGEFLFFCDVKSIEYRRGSSSDHFSDHFSEGRVGVLSSQVNVPVAGSVAGGATDPVGEGDIVPESDMKSVQHGGDEECQDPEELEDMFEDANDGTNDGMNDDQDCDDKDAKEEEGDKEEDCEDDDKDEDKDAKEEDGEEKDCEDNEEVKQSEEEDDEFDPDSIIPESAFWHVSSLPSLADTLSLSE